MNIIRKIRGSHSVKDEEIISAVKNLLGFKPKNIEHYKEAFTHSSLKKTNKLGTPINYERLEFLGDAVLEIVVTDHLFKKYPDKTEGELTSYRAALVNSVRSWFNQFCKKFNTKSKFWRQYSR